MTTHVPRDLGHTAATDGRTCPGCGETVDQNWRFCPRCGHKAPDADADNEAPALQGEHGQDADSPGKTDNSADFQPIPGSTEWPAPRKRRRRRKRRPFYRRKRVLVPTIAMLCILVIVTAMLYRANSMLSTVREISTPPPMITDNTFEEEETPDESVPDDADSPGGPAQPISIDTGPAQKVLEQAYETRNLPRPATDDIGSIGRMSSGFKDMAGGAAIASGIQGGDSEAEGFTMLLMGVDARPGAAIDIGVRPDLLLLVRFEPETKSCRMLSIPRDTRVELPGYGQSKINHALMVGGIPYQILVTEDFTGASIDHYALIDFVAFSQIVDMLGGVTVTVPEDLEKNGELRFTKGTHHFDGDDALGYARFRVAQGGGDLDRIDRQWSLMSSVAEAANGRDLVGDLNDLLPTVEDHVRTDLTVTEMAEIARTYGNGCLSVDAESVDMLRGTRVQLQDPILNQVLYYNIVAPPIAREHVESLVGIDATLGPIDFAAKLSGWSLTAPGQAWREEFGST